MYRTAFIIYELVTTVPYPSWGSPFPQQRGSSIATSREKEKKDYCRIRLPTASFYIIQYLLVAEKVVKGRRVTSGSRYVFYSCCCYFFGFFSSVRRTSTRTNAQHRHSSNHHNYHHTQHRYHHAYLCSSFRRHLFPRARSCHGRRSPESRMGVSSGLAHSSSFTGYEV